MSSRPHETVELPLRRAYPFLAVHGLTAEAQQIRDTAPPAALHESVFRRALVVDLLSHNDLLEQFIREYWAHGATEAGQALLSGYRRVLARRDPPISSQSRRSSPGRGAGARGSGTTGTGSADDQRTRFVVFVRGMAMFAARRVRKREQEALLRSHLPSTITFLGAFNKSGNYALVSQTPPGALAEAVLAALHHHDALQDLTLPHITVIAAGTVDAALTDLAQLMGSRYANKFNGRTFAVEFERHVWRAGLAFLPEPLSVTDFDWPTSTAPKVRVFAGNGQVVRFLKREDAPGEDRISFGDPTRAIDAALNRHLGRTVATTSRSGRTVRGILRLLGLRSETSSSVQPASVPR